MILGTFLRHELRIQLRSLRFLVLVSAFLVVAALPPLVVFIRWHLSPFYLGPASFAAAAFALLPVLTAAMGFSCGIDGIQREREEGSWAVLSMAPLSHAGYVLRRWVAIWLPLLPVVSAPPIVAAGLAWFRCGEIALAPLVWPMLFQVLPLLLLSSAAGLAFGTLGRGILGGVLWAAMAFATLSALLRLATGGLHLSLAGLQGFLNLEQARWAVLGTWRFLRGGRGLQSYPLPDSEAPFDPRVAGEQYLAHGLVAFGAVFLLLALTVFFLGRVQRDLRPWSISPSHPLRNLLAYLNRLRQRIAPDGGWGWRDAGFLALGGLAFGATLVLQADRALHYRQAAERRLAATRVRVVATPTSVVPVRCVIQGNLDPAGRLESTSTVVLENRGRQPESNLDFALGEGLRISSLRSSGKAIVWSRRWETLHIDLPTPIPPGERLSLTFQVSGRPFRHAFDIAAWIGADGGVVGAKDFDTVFRPSRGRGTAHLELSYTVPALSDRRLALAARDLMPIPRYLSAGPDAPPEELDVSGSARRPDPFRPSAELEIDLETPPGLFAADSCGGLVTANAPDRRLRSRCHLPVSELAVVGGHYRLVSAQEGGPVVAAYPRHAELARSQLATSLAREAGLVRDLWPGMGGPSSWIVVEWPDSTVHRLDSYLLQDWNALDRFDNSLALARGRLILLAERRLVRREPLEIAPLVARTFANQLLARRLVQPEEQEVFRRFYEELAKLRMGSAPRTGAVVSPLPGGPGAVAIPLLDAGPANRSYWEDRFPALVFALENRIGESAVIDAVNRFTSQPGEGSLAGLVAELHQSGGQALGSFVQDFFGAGVLPQLDLAQVRLRQRHDGWRVDGEVVNVGGGQAVCTVEALTGVGSVTARVVAEPERPGRFALETRYRPRLVLLDPEQLCHRYRRLIPPPIERVDLSGAV